MKDFMKKLLYGCNGMIYLVLIGLWIAIPEEKTLNLAVTLFNLCFSSVLIVWDQENLKKYYMSSQFKGLVQASISAALVFAILGVINYLSYKHPASFDLSQMQSNTLTSESQDVLKKIKEPLTIKVFARKNELGVIKALAELYRYQKNNIAIELIDIDLRPAQVAKYGIQQSGVVVVESGDRRQRTNQLSELAITNAIVKVTREKDPLIYYVVGHGELDLDLMENNGAAYLKSLIQKSSYRIQKVQLSDLKSIPSEVQTLIIWGPKSAFLEEELQLIDRYLKKGGRLMAAIDPDLNGDRVPGLRQLIRKWGIKIENQLVIDRLKHVNGSDGTVPIINTFSPYHQITKELKAQVFLPLTTSVNQAVIEEGDQFELLASSSAFPASWGDNNPKEVVQGTLTFDPKVDLKGPMGLAASVLKKTSNAKIVAFGNSTFVINTYKKFGKNFQFFIKSLNWLIEDNPLKSFNLPIMKEEPVFISGPQVGVIFYAAVIFAPLTLFLTSFAFYRKRRVL